jgi:EAL domain-containing protein (putative c-di-GMP-specific phosphodiesterase class I)
MEPDFGGYVRKHVDNSSLSNGALGFEITWDDAIEHQESVRQLMAELRPHGCRFTLSGFDASEAAFTMLKTFAPHFVKISAATIDPESLADINRRCHSLECKTIVEQVEDGKVLEHLRLTKIDFAQGFEVSPVEPL